MSHTHPIISRLRDERLRQGMSIRELARRSGYSDRAIGAMETGESKPIFSMVAVIAEVLDLRLMLTVKERGDG
jgi:transcriptional regulator with XRE-family HTH domain